MSLHPGPPAAGGVILVSGPPGSGVPLAQRQLVRMGLAVERSEGAPADADRLQDAALVEAGYRLLLSLEASDGRCLGRAGPPWALTPWPRGRRPSLAVLGAARALLRPARARAQLRLDTTQLGPAAVGRRLRRLVPLALDPTAAPILVLESFSFLLGPPLDAEWIIDARFLRNPFWEPELRGLTGRDAAVRRFVLDQPAATAALTALGEMVHAVEPAYRERGRRLLRVAVGCTGGQHRSVAMVEAASRAWRRRGRLAVAWHRDCPLRP